MKNFTTYILSLLLLSSFVYAESSTINPNKKIGDGKNGSVFAKWTYRPAEGEIESINAKVRRVSGSDSTYINLRFSGGESFESGKRVYLRSDQVSEVSWSVSQKVNSRDLVMNAYNGEVLVEEVQIRYSSRVANNNSSNTNDSNTNSGSSSSSGNNASSGTIEACKRGDYRRPRINIDEVRSSGGLFSGKYRFYGVLTGSCLVEAGYYERGRLRKEIEVETKDIFGSYPIEIQVKSGERAKIRAYTVTGNQVEIDVDETIKEFN